MLKRPPTNDSAFHIALLVETSTVTGRDIIRGVARYLREHGKWSVFNSPRGRDDPTPQWLPRWQGHGIIARVTTREMAAMLEKTGLPVVDVLGAVVGTRLPLVHVDDAAIAH